MNLDCWRDEVDRLGGLWECAVEVLQRGEIEFGKFEDEMEVEDGLKMSRIEMEVG